MKSRTDSPHKTDFSEVMALFVERGIIKENADSKLVEVSKAIHKSTYSLILWRFRLGDLPIHSSIFLDEMSSDALQILPQVLMGYNKAASLLIRGVLENALRHIYFSDHPVEFARLNRDKKWYLTNDNLLEYTKNHFDFVKTEHKFDCLGQISSLYSTMSESVHGRTINNLELHDALARINFDQKQAEKHADTVAKSAQAVNFLLAIYHRDALRAFPTRDKSLLLRSMPENARAIWNEHE